MMKRLLSTEILCARAFCSGSRGSGSTFSSRPRSHAMQLVHDMWCHPGNDKMEQIFKARRGRGFPRGFITKLRKFHCATCAVSKRTRRYRRSKRVKVAAAKLVKRPPPSEHRKLTRCANAQANRRRKSRALVQLSSSCRATDVSVFSGAHREWQVI